MSDETDKGPAKSFANMQELIRRNEAHAFGGAAVIIPPMNGGDPIELLMLDTSNDAAQFWSTIKTRIEIILEKLAEQQRIASGFPRR